MRGLILGCNSDAPIWAEVRVTDREQPVFTNPEVSNYHRLLLPGTYDFSFHAEGYIAYHVDDVPVVEGPATRVNVPLSDGDLNDDGVVDGADIQAVINRSLEEI